MCDTICLLTPAGALLAKNSDRPAGEVQLPEVHGRRAGGGRLHTQYLEIPDTGACRVLLSRPDWLWGAEHGLNEHGVAIGNEKVDTVSGVSTASPALIGMDLVRLGLERADSADAAVDVMVGLLERHGQGGIGDRTFQQAYDSSFLVADASSAWVLETAGRSWAAEPVPAGGSAAISNRLGIRRDWTRASDDVVPGSDFDAWRDPGVDTAYADGRLSASRRFLADVGSASASGSEPLATVARRTVAHLRDHGTGPWGMPGEPRRSATAVPPPAHVDADGTGISVCMHISGLMATTASMIAVMPTPDDAPLRCWLALGSPCVSVYVPRLGLGELPSGPADGRLWRLTAALRDRVEADGEYLLVLRDRLDRLEDDLWEEADELALDDQPDRWARFHLDSWRRVAETTAALEAGSAQTAH